MENSAFYVHEIMITILHSFSCMSVIVLLTTKGGSIHLLDHRNCM